MPGSGEGEIDSETVLSITKSDSEDLIHLRLYHPDDRRHGRGSASIAVGHRGPTRPCYSVFPPLTYTSAASGGNSLDLPTTMQ